MTVTIYELCGANEWHLFSPHCWKVRMSVAHKGLDWRVEPVPFTKISEIEGGVSKTVPVIRDGDVVMRESLDIARYLDATYGGRPLIGGAQADQLTQFVISWSQGAVHPLVAKAVVTEIHDALAPEDRKYFRASREASFGTTLEEFMKRGSVTKADFERATAPFAAYLGRADYLGGEEPIFADYVVFGALQWLRLSGGEAFLPDGAVGAWFERLLDAHDGMGRAALAA